MNTTQHEQLRDTGARIPVKSEPIFVPTFEVDLQIHRIPSLLPHRPCFYSYLMVQGQVKGIQKGKGNAARHAAAKAAAPKKGRRYVAPKKVALVKNAVLHKVCRRIFCSIAAFPTYYTGLSLGTQREDKQEYRAASCSRRILRQTHDHEERRDGGVCELTTAKSIGRSSSLPVGLLIRKNKSQSRKSRSPRERFCLQSAAQIA